MVVIFKGELEGVGVGLWRACSRREGCGGRDHCFGVGNRKPSRPRDEEFGMEMVSCSLGFYLLSISSKMKMKRADL
jgi:hypothetical protein